MSVLRITDVCPDESQGGGLVSDFGPARERAFLGRGGILNTDFRKR
jgi:hypothetical protein